MVPRWLRLATGTWPNAVFHLFQMDSSAIWGQRRGPAVVASINREGPWKFSGKISGELSELMDRKNPGTFSGKFSGKDSWKVAGMLSRFRDREALRVQG